MDEQDHGDTGRRSGLLARRMARIGLEPARLTPAQRDILDEIGRRCPTCEQPERCAAGLATAPDRGWEDWDEYCPNAARLRILAALTMFPPDE